MINHGVCDRSCLMIDHKTSDRSHMLLLLNDSIYVQGVGPTLGLCAWLHPMDPKHSGMSLWDSSYNTP